METQDEITQLLVRLHQGEKAAEPQLYNAVYAELRAIAERHMRRERQDHTLQATALVNEAYLKLVNTATPWQNRAHFVAVASRAMRQILVDHSRQKVSAKRAGGVRVELSADCRLPDSRPETMLALDAALSRLSKWDARQAQIVDMRFFGGLSEEEIAPLLRISLRTVKRDWDMARAWLSEQIG
ncbi:MAG TPA: ECF-type sigma factor [Bryobacteraceae bacterium]|nr:ECF-type sigma factor [Bryobacteraceae bacterium]